MGILGALFAIFKAFRFENISSQVFYVNLCFKQVPIFILLSLTKLIDTWVREEKSELLEETFQVITGLRIWNSINNNLAYQLNDTFRYNLQKGI